MEFKNLQNNKTKRINMKRKLLIIKIGSDERPSGADDIKAMKKKIKRFSKKGKSLKGYDVIVTHHLVDFDFLKFL